jgi:hypothetical protein
MQNVCHNNKSNEKKDGEKYNIMLNHEEVEYDWS